MEKKRTDVEEIKQVLFDFEDGGLISKDLNKIVHCISDQIIGIGIGEQGFVTSKEEICKVFEMGQKLEDDAKHSLIYERIEVLTHDGLFATVCADISVLADSAGKVSKSRLQQSLTMTKKTGQWKICGLHASTPIITEENLEAYPLKFAEKTLQNLKEKIGEKAYEAEEQYRQAVLADTVAFYIINFTKDVFEKCQINNDLCAYVEANNPYQQFIIETSPQFIFAEDVDKFLQTFSLQNVAKAFSEHRNELSCEYRFLCPDESILWMVTVIRLITDVVTGEQKGIMYVKNIDCNKRQELEMLKKADYDEMTDILNKGAMLRRVNQCLLDQQDINIFAFIMLDVDNFKTVNDHYGHPLGDRLLIAIARILRNCFSAGSIIGRLGGDEFAIFLTEPLHKFPAKEGCTSEYGQQEYHQQERQHHMERKRNDFIKGLADTAQDTLNEINHLCFSLKITTKISCSMGIAICEGGLCFEDIYQKADAALYESKRNGKNTYTINIDSHFESSAI